MSDIENTIDSTAAAGRRLRPNTIEEQAEMIRLGRHLLAANVSREEMQKQLGYNTLDELDTALATGRASTLRLDRLREMADARLPMLLQRHTEETAQKSEYRSEQLAERFRAHTERLAAESAAAPTPVVRTGKIKRERRKDYLSPKQHERLRSQIEHLWTIEPRFKNWSLLAHISGLSTGPAIKRAYEVGSSNSTLQKIDNFVRIYQAFGTRALKAAKQGIETDDLQKYLMATTGMPGAANAAPNAMNNDPQVVAQITPAVQPAAPQPPAPTLDTLPHTPPSIDFQNVLALATAVDTEVKRLWLTAEFFEKLSAEPSMPSIIRQNATGAVEKLREALAFFSPNKP